MNYRGPVTLSWTGSEGTMQGPAKGAPSHVLSVEEIRDELFGGIRVEPVTEVYVVEWQCFNENGVILVTLDKAQAEAYAAEKNAARTSRLDVEYTVSPWTLGEVENDF